MRHAFLVGLVGTCLGACADPGSTVILTVFDPCAPLVVATRDDTTAEQRDAVGDSVALWNELSGTALLVDEGPATAPRVTLAFEDAPGAIYGLYQDEIGNVLVNGRLDREQQVIVIAHELGHAFGLLHIDDSSSVMQTPNLDVAPSAIDDAALQTLWGDCSRAREVPTDR